MKILKLLLLMLLLVIIVTGIFFWVNFYINDQETKTMSDEARKNAPGLFIKLTNGITHYESAGPDTAQAIILVHGFSVPYYVWDSTYYSLVQNGFHVVRYDEFGRGYSDRPHLTYDQAFYRKQLFDLISSLKLKTPVNLAGLSFGGPVITDFTVNYPELVDKLILVDPVYVRKKLEKSDWVANYEMALDHEKQASGQLTDFKYPGKFQDWVNKYNVQMKYKGFRHALISTRKNYYGDIIISNYKRLAGLNKKVLLIWGKEDITSPFAFSDSLRKYLPVDFLQVDDAAHVPILEKPGVVNRRIISFLKR